MPLYQSNESSLPLTILYEVLPEDEHVPDPHALDQAAHAVVDALRQDGYTVVPVPTTERGGELFEIGKQLPEAYHFVVTNKDSIISAFKSIILPIFQRIYASRQQRQAEAATLGGVTVKANFTPDSYSVELETHDLLGTEKLDPLLEKLALQVQARVEKDALSSPTAHTPSKALPAPQLTISERVPKRQKHGRKRL